METRHLGRGELDRIERQAHSQIVGHVDLITAVFTICGQQNGRTAQLLGIESAPLSNTMECRDRIGARRQRVRERQLVQRQIRVEILKILKPANRNPGVADSVSRQWMIGIHRRHRWRITDHIQTASAFFNQLAKLFIGTSSGALA